MKLEALDHPKTMELATQLEVELPTAIGYLELFWAFVAKKTPRGDVGKWSDGVIASACMWRGKASQFVQALVSARFVDADADHRLLVHDWPQHCPNWVRAKLKKDGVEFALKSVLKTDSNADSSDGTSRADLNQGKAREGKGREAHIARVEIVSRETLSPEFESFMLATYPDGKPDADFSKAIHFAMGLVGSGWLSEETLRRRVAGYRAYVDSQGVSGRQYVIKPQNWFNPTNPDKPWDKDWCAVPSKAQQHQDANIAASQAWLARSSANA